MDTIAPKVLLQRLLDNPNLVVNVEVPFDVKFTLDLPTPVSGVWVQDGMIIRPGTIRFRPGKTWLVLMVNTNLTFPDRSIIVTNRR